jgi:beta-phosphoglucomutase-like phosphatase (HAD superfamily)
MQNDDFKANQNVCHSIQASYFGDTPGDSPGRTRRASSGQLDHNQGMAISLVEGTFSALIFDCDGTLVDSAPAHLHSLQTAFQPLGLEMAPDWYGTRHGLSPDHLIDEYEAEFKVPLIDRVALFQRNNAAYQAAISLIREVTLVADIARAWHGRVPMSVASNGVRANVEATLVSTKLRPLFDHIVTAGDVRHGKPAPDVYLEAARRMKVDPAACIVFEDSDEGLQAAHSAGMRGIDIRNELVSATSSGDSS